jgi:hypothetical protein
MRRALLLSGLLLSCLALAFVNGRNSPYYGRAGHALAFRSSELIAISHSAFLTEVILPSKAQRRAQNRTRPPIPSGASAWQGTELDSIHAECTCVLPVRVY